MKKLTTIIAGFFLLFIVSAFTPSPANVSAKIKAVFEDNFSPVSEVKWTKHEDLYVASFKEEDNYITAAYNEDGELLIVGKYIPFSQLPKKVIKAIEKKYEGYGISQSVIELTTDSKRYIIDVQNNKYMIRLNCDASGFISVDSKTRK